MKTSEQYILQAALGASGAGPILHEELTMFWNQGASERAQSIWSILATLEANVANERLSAESFREVAGQILERVRTECVEK